MATGGGKQPTFRTAHGAQRTPHPLCHVGFLTTEDCGRNKNHTALIVQREGLQPKNHRAQTRRRPGCAKIESVRREALGAPLVRPETCIKGSKDLILSSGGYISMSVLLVHVLHRQNCINTSMAPNWSNNDNNNNNSSN